MSGAWDLDGGEEDPKPGYRRVIIEIDPKHYDVLTERFDALRERGLLEGGAESTLSGERTYRLTDSGYQSLAAMRPRDR